MGHEKLFLELERIFSDIGKPWTIYNKHLNNISKEQLMIQKDFTGISRKDMTAEQASMMIIDGSLISDKAFLYYLPTMLGFLSNERINEYLLYSRLEKTDFNLLTKEQKEILEKVITILKKIEQETEAEEERDIERSWSEWEKERLKKGTRKDIFLLAAAKGEIRIVRNLLNQGVNMDTKDDKGNTALGIAKMREQKVVIDFLIQQDVK